MHTHGSSLPQIELLINRPTPTWQRLRFSTAVLIISPILLIWQNPKIKQSPHHPHPTPSSAQHVSGAWCPAWSNGIRMLGCISRACESAFPPSTHSCPGLGFLLASPGGWCAGPALRAPRAPALFCRGSLPFCILGFSFQDVY